MKKKKWIIVIPVIILFLLFWMEEAKPYEVLHSTVMSSPNLTENKITLVVHSLLPIDKEALAKKFVENHMRLNGGRPNQYFELKLYRTELHHRLGNVYDTLLCNDTGEIVTEVEF
ncbi:MAG: hypothetical protein HFG82_04730 [Dorea sp.]|jgi:hypothetical protein|nr:hypothetical protein [Dorea sp.]GFI44667.1 hypothetical protein IMSAGC018_02348 [Lachnospiraceae bacterium]